VPKVIALISRIPGMPLEDFLHHWQVDHPPYVWALPGVRRYVQNVAIAGYRDWAYDGAAELWFDSVGDVARAFASEAAGPMHEHEKAFIHEITWFLADETDVVPVDRSTAS
jgi:uncharacterized protein (TIGR02118 family)